MFEISRRNDALSAPSASLPDVDALRRFFVSEEWTSDLSSGVIQLGEQTSFMHGLAPGECGLLSLIRCYDRAHHARVLELFERASTEASRFCFSSGISISPAMRQPVICFGESSGFEDGQQGRMCGLFLFPRVEDLQFAA